MPGADIVAWTAVAVAAAAIGWRRLLAYLRYFQQEGYEGGRFVRWVGVRPLLDPVLWLGAGCLWLALARPRLAIGLFLAGVALAVALQPDPRRSGKIRLALTWRAVRILTLASVFAIVVWTVVAIVAPLAGVAAGVAATIGIVGGVPILLVAANVVLEPYEAATQRWYESDAARRVCEIQPVIIGITGSYGKSSAKAMLAHVLELHGPTLAASGSINTLMGVTRHIRENLMPGHQFMIVEMGAFKTGSIARLCQLTPPSAALITAVGDMHLERFGSLEAIVQAKGELARALPPRGLLVVNADSPGALQIGKASADQRVLLYGETSTEALATRLENVRVSKEGTRFALRTPARVFEAFTPLFGRPIMLNMTGVFTLATAIGADPELTIGAFRTLKPVANRLEVVEERGITWIRDAYNSNQFGFRAALEVAAALPAERRILVTPGVIELGAEQARVNRTLAAEAAAVCDTTLVVSGTNRAAFEAGYKDAGQAEQLVPVRGRKEAFAWLDEHLKPGDLVILENDLPDLYERADGVFVRRFR
jgi:UDP-N-acetylmuramoyl-tripeptide--D-alanyl-D-alanine ligase